MISKEEELVIALERSINRWKAKPNSITSSLIERGEKILEEYRTTGEISRIRQLEAKELIELSNKKFIQS